LLPIRLSLALFLFQFRLRRCFFLFVSRVFLLIQFCVSLALLLFRFRSLLQYAVKLIVVFNVFAQCFRLLFPILFRRLHRCGFLFVYRLFTLYFACVSVSPSLSDLLLPLPLCLSFALFLFRSLLQFIAKVIVVFNVFAQSNPTTRTPTTYRPMRTPPARTPTSRGKGTPTSRRKGSPTSRWKGAPTNPQTRPPD
jgi:hypothetical protein